ncbi:MAG TPA: FecR domain-containing protein [Puia sp.]|nr:FecR domain-containing protein [Puia sp.]
MYPSEKDKEYFFELLSKYNVGKTTPQEAEFVESYLYILEHRSSDVLNDFEQEKSRIGQDIKDRLFSTIHQKTPSYYAQEPIAHQLPFLRRHRWWAVAAALVLLLGTGTYSWFQQNRQSRIARAKMLQDAPPGKNGAILTLSNGSQVVLDSLGNGVVAIQGSMQVVLKNGELVYDSKHQGSGISTQQSDAAYNTMSTPRGRQFHVQLPDGTQVWLNSASSIRYPTVFTGRERKVEISGEAYFEVAKNAKIPFKVKINNNTEVEVLGTHFNINAYSDEASIKTTLLEGSVKVSLNNKTELLSPGQQAQVSDKDAFIKVIKNADLTQAVAWKNGYFSFHEAKLEEVMRQLSRWYDMDVIYEGKVDDRHFGGNIDRSSTASQTLKILEESDIHFRIEDKKIIVTP